MFLTLNSLYFSLLSLIFTFSLTEGLCSIEPIYLLFVNYTQGICPIRLFPFALFSAAIRYLPFAPMSLQQVLAISRHTVAGTIVL